MVDLYLQTLHAAETHLVDHSLPPVDFPVVRDTPGRCPRLLPLRASMVLAGHCSPDFPVAALDSVPARQTIEISTAAS